MGKTTKDQMGRVVHKTGDDTPVVVLVRPQLGQNIGAACRCMLNFGLTELRLVAPRDGWPNPDADSMAAGAVDVLQNVQVYESVEAAVADLSFVLAATARRRELEIPVIGTHKAIPMMQAHIAKDKRTGILFGPEKAGLTNDDVVLADAILTYPVNPAFQSLNLAQAVNIFAFLWANEAHQNIPDMFEDVRSETASRKDLIRLFTHLEDELETAGFFFPPEKKLIMSQNIRAPLMRADMSEQEVRTFRGIVKALVKGRGQALLKAQGKIK